MNNYLWFRSTLHGTPIFCVAASFPYNKVNNTRMITHIFIYHSWRLYVLPSYDCLCKRKRCMIICYSWYQNICNFVPWFMYVRTAWSDRIVGYANNLCLWRQALMASTFDRLSQKLQIISHFLCHCWQDPIYIYIYIAGWPAFIFPTRQNQNCISNLYYSVNQNISFKKNKN